MKKNKKSPDFLYELRRIAEKRVDPDRDELYKLSPQDVRALAYELEVHRVEIEIQNEQLRDSQLELAQTRDRYLDLYENAPIGYLILDDAHLIIETNVRAALLLAAKREEIVGKALERFLSRESAAKFVLLLGGLGEPGARASAELKFACPNGKEAYMNAEIVRAGREFGKNAAFRLTVSDATEQKAFEMARLATARRKDEFLAVLGHELRNPIAAIQTSIDALRGQVFDDAKKRAAMEVLVRGVDRVSRIINDLIDVSWIVTGRIQLAKRVLKLQDELVKDIDGIREAAARRSVDLRVDIQSSPVWVEADAVRLGQALTNLLANAIKFTGPGGSVSVSLRDDAPGTAKVTIRDTGLGMDRETILRIFSLFERFEPDFTFHEGLGIGLVIAVNLVRMHGGEIRAESEGPGRGSAFTVTLPVVENRLIDSGPAQAKPARHPGSPGPKKILLVDDNEDFISELAELIADLGHETRICFRGLEAVEAAAAFVPDVVFLDLGLPDLNGYEVARLLAARPELASTKVVSLSGYGAGIPNMSAEGVRFHRNLIKPVKIDELEKILETL